MKKNPPDFGDLLSFLLLFLLSVSLVQFFLFFFTLMNVNIVRRNKAKSVKKKKRSKVANDLAMGTPNKKIGT